MSEYPSKRQKIYSLPGQAPQPPKPVMEADDSMTSTTPSSVDPVQQPSQADDNDMDLFPDSAASNMRPQTPPRNDHLNASAPGELSPPRSQHNPTSMTNGNYSNVHDAPVAQSAALIEGHDAPGDGWKSKRAQDEYRRALEFIVDQDFSLKEFGDVVQIGKQQRGIR